MMSRRVGLELEVVDLTIRSATDSEEEEIVFSRTALLPNQPLPSIPSLRKELSLFNGVTLIVGAIIGSGIFFTPKIVLYHTGSLGVSMVAWMVGALIALAGSLCYMELGLLVRSSGGEYSFLLEGYSFNRRNKGTTLLGGCIAFLYIWCSVFIVRPGSFAILTLTCAHYLAQPFFIDCSAPEAVVKLIALAIVISVGAVNVYSVRLTAQIIAVVTVLKLFAVLFIALLGIATLISRRSFPEDPHNWFTPREGFQLTASNLALAFYGVLWSYDGWSVIFFAFEETKNVEKTLPRSLFIAVPIVALCYLLVNISYFGVLSYQQILAGEAIALTFGSAVLGRAGLVLFPLMVALSTCGASVGGVYSGSRVSFVAARDGMLPAFLSGLHTSYQTPLPAIILHVFGGCALILIGDISELLNGLSAVIYLFYTLIFSSVLIMRVTRRREPRPFKAWFIVPVTLFSIAASLFLTFLPLQQNPVPSLVAFGVMLLGLPVYFLVVMETPWRLRPRLLDVITKKLTKFTGNLLNTQLAK
ncbi:b(0,+)-type amino acid transporter 1-like [Halichondria panicea]|uniref:b(0,+)-type amino acid transporter 1-like n=1 Tax=Halichondria panicea TaxID=6063 RepID=UPI00312B648B